MPTHETLTTASSDLTEVVPVLATEWESMDDTTWEFTLRDDVKFHNGKSLTADIAAKSLKKMYEAMPFGFTRLSPDSFTALDELTLEMETETPNPALPGQVAQIFHTISYVGDNARGGLIGTGPFKVKADASAPVPQDEPVTVTAFDGYWNGPPPLDELVLEGISDNTTRALALEGGEVDVGLEIPKQRYKAFEESEDITVKTIDEAETLITMINIYKPPTDDQKLRLALQYATDQEALVKNFLEGFGRPAKSFFAPMLEWSAHDELPDYGPDMERAQQLVDESNYEGEEISLGVMGGKPTFKRIATWMQQTYGQLGVNVNVRVLEPASHYPKFYQGEIHLHLGDWAFWSADGTELIWAMLHSEGFVNKQMVKKNDTGVTNLGEKTDQLIEKGYATFDEEERYSIFRKVVTRVMDAGAIIPLRYKTSIHGMRSDVSGPELHGLPFMIDWSTLSRK